jgi:hypothetical protein
VADDEKLYTIFDVRMALDGANHHLVRRIAAELGIELPQFRAVRGGVRGIAGGPKSFTKLEAALVMREFHRRRGDRLLRKAQAEAVRTECRLRKLRASHPHGSAA